MVAARLHPRKQTQNPIPGDLFRYGPDLGTEKRRKGSGAGGGRYRPKRNPQGQKNGPQKPKKSNADWRMVSEGRFWSLRQKVIVDVLSAIVADAILIASISSDACGRNGDADLSRSAEIIAQRIGAMSDHTLHMLGKGSHGLGSLQDWIMPGGGRARVNGEYRVRPTN